MSDIDAAVALHQGRSLIALQYTQTTKRLNDAAKQPGFTKDSWADLAALVAVDEFERVGNFKEVMNWTEYIEFLTNWAPSSEWDGSFKRVSEVNGVVFLELEERSRVGDFESVVNSLTVFEFTAEDKIRHLDLYLQMALPNLDMLGSYDGAEISE